MPLTPATPVHDLRKWSADTAEELCEPVAAETEPDGGEIEVGEAEVVIVARPPSTDPNSLSDLRSAAAAAAFKARQQAQAEEFDGGILCRLSREVEEASVEIVRQYPAPSGNAETSHLPTATAPVAVKSQPVGIEEKAGLDASFALSPGTRKPPQIHFAECNVDGCRAVWGRPQRRAYRRRRWNGFPSSPDLQSALP